MDTFYITTPIYYANSAPHLGSLYTTVVADCIRRHQRQLGLDTYFLTGTDEHGVNIERVAAAKGLTPKAHVDEVAQQFKDMFAAFGLDTGHGGYDIFMRTTEPFHYEGVARFWRAVREAQTPKGRKPLYKGLYEGWFCAKCAAYKSEDDYTPPAKPGEPPTCPDHLSALELISEEGYFFRLGDYADALLEIYRRQPAFIQPEARRNEVISFVASGLQDLAVSRLKSSVSWGIPVPDDPEHVIYVWFDALTNYITALGYGNAEQDEKAGFAKYWPGVHLVGKDILRFHAVYWPAFLLAAGLPLPKTVFAHGMLLDQQGRKMGKALGNVVDLALARRFFTNDMIRYFLLREVVFGQDGKVGYESLLERSNSDLASGLGNLLSRTVSMLRKYAAGKLPPDVIPEENYLAAKRANVEPDPQGLATAWELAREQFCANFGEYAFSRGIEAVWSVLAKVDKMISDAKPWELAKQPESSAILQAVLYRAAESLRWAAVLLFPVMPEAARTIYQQLGISGAVDSINPRRLKWGELAPGLMTGQAQALFPRLDRQKIMAEIESEAATNEPAARPDEAVPEPAYITIEDFAKVELKVGQVLRAERVPKADKLLVLQVDAGESEPRQILAGIAQYYEPESLVGRKLVIVANLAPRKLRGLESQGMVVAASFGEEGRPVVATFLEEVPNGARLK